MESRQPQGMWRNYVAFALISLVLFLLNIYLNPAPKPKPIPEKAVVQQQEAGKAKPAQPVAEQKSSKPAEGEKPPAVEPEPEVAAEQPEPPEQYLTLGSADPNAPYRGLVTFTTRGAAVARIELSSKRYRDLEYRGGYMGHLVMDPDQRGNGALVQVVGDGTPAAKAGIKPGDLIQKVNGFAVTGYKSLEEAMDKTSPDQTVPVSLGRDGKDLTVSVTLTRRPMEVVRPENSATAPEPLVAGYATKPAPYSYLMTLKQVDDQKLPDFNEASQSDQDKTAHKWPRPELSEELKGVHLREGNWEVVSHTQSEVVFSRQLPKWGLEVRKSFRLAEVPKDQIDNRDYKAYHLVFNVEILNHSKAPHKVAYQMDGPSGLPLEGYWYANKIGRNWGAVGLRDFVVSFNNRIDEIGAPAIADGKVVPPYQGDPLTFIGIDAQYFSAVMIPQMKSPNEIWFAESQPLRIGPVDPQWLKLTNTTYRVTSTVHELKPEGSLSQSFDIFAGPKRPDLLAQYGLQDIIVYGWFWWVAKPMLWTLHFFYSIVRNYGIAIILLTVLVRGCMFPLSIKQAAGAQKMQQLQPELKKLQEKYKGDLEGRNRAQQELFRKYNYNPASGCLIVFLQLPIFVGLYRSLMVDVELRQAPLFSEAIRWCSNLAAPDMFYNWSWLVPHAVSYGNSFYSLGPYFNLLPIFTVILFIWQQKMLMPPPADEQAAMQQKVMQYMMVVMGVLFFKVASGLCLYFIASSFWSMAERKLLPKAVPAGAGSEPPAQDTGVSRAKTLAAKLLPGGTSNGDRVADRADRKKKRSRPKR